MDSREEGPVSPGVWLLCVVGTFLILGSFYSIFGAASSSLFHTLTIQGATNDVITNTIQIFDSPSTKQNDTVLLEGMSLIRNVSNDLVTRRKTHLGNLANCRIWFLGCSRGDLHANPSAKRTGFVQAI